MKRTAFVALLLVCGSAAARDVGQIPSHSDPKISTWFRTAKSPSGTSCCDEADGYREGVAVRMAHGEPTVIFRSWWVASDGYHLSLVDPEDLRSIHLIWESGRIEARTGLRMMPTFPRSSLSFRTAGFPQYGWKAGFCGAFPDNQSA